MIDFQQIFNVVGNLKKGNQKKIPINSPLEVFFGYNFDGNLRLSFMSKSIPPQIQSTKILHVFQGRESNSTYWTSFDLMNDDLKDAYFSFCENMIDSVTDVNDENTALSILKRRFITWKTLFRNGNGTEISRERLLGLFGELKTITDVIGPKYGIDKAILAWGGPDMQSKDFTIENTWYETKTIGANSDRIHISSITQLASELAGHLVVVRAEEVSAEFSGQSFSIIDLVKGILLKITNEDIENIFVEKIQSLGIDIYGNEMANRFNLRALDVYTVSDGFPRITDDSINYPEIIELSYSISVAGIERFKES